MNNMGILFIEHLYDPITVIPLLKKKSKTQARQVCLTKMSSTLLLWDYSNDTIILINGKEEVGECHEKESLVI